MDVNYSYDYTDSRKCCRLLIYKSFQSGITDTEILLAALFDLEAQRIYKIIISFPQVPDRQNYIKLVFDTEG